MHFLELYGKSITQFFSTWLISKENTTHIKTGHSFESYDATDARKDTDTHYTRVKLTAPLILVKA